MKIYPQLFLKRSLSFLILLALLGSTVVFSQGSACGAAGSINRGANPLLDRNSDGYFSVYNGSGFVNASDEYLEFEILTATGGANKGWMQLGGTEPDSDIQTGGGCGNTDLVTDANGGQDFAYYSVVDPDGTADNGDEYLVFALRVANKTNGAFGFSFLMDSDNNCGTTDPNNVCGNPCFEYEIQLSTGNSGGSVQVFDVDGCTGTADCDALAAGGDADLCGGDCNTGGIQVCAGSSNCPTGDPVFWIFHVNFSDLPGVNSSDAFSLTPASTTSGNSVLYKNTNVSDYGGVDDINDIGGTCDCNTTCAGSSCSDCLQDCLLACASTNTGVNQPFPVIWQGFDARNHDSGVWLAWSVVEYGGVTGYQVERASADNGIFEVVEWMPIEEVNDGQERTYRHLDPITRSGSYLYRIRMIEIDGSVSLSSLASITVDRAVQITWSTTDHIGQVSLEQDGYATVSLYSLNGKELAMRTLSGRESTVDFSQMELPRGMYFLRVAAKGITPKATSIIW